jgi:(2R)-sulfolactate sulfo-lyase subunit alpha
LDRQEPHTSLDFVRPGNYLIVRSFYLLNHPEKIMTQKKEPGSGKPGFLVHDTGDSVGVAVADLAPQTRANGRLLAGDEIPAVTLHDAVPLGHKLALRPIARGERVIKYGQVIGAASADIQTGAHVHVHNLKGLRWGKKENK